MKKYIILMLGLVLSNTITSQEVQYFKNTRGQKHLCGLVSLEVLEKDSVSKKWFNKNYTNFHLLDKKRSWVKNLENIEVDIYMGTWCGDTKKLVPQFVKIWDKLGLNRKQLKFIALYSGGTGKYKQSPNREEKGKGIIKVPTFVFKKGDKEIARIVEKPVNNVETDIAQIALGCPSIPNYRGASYLFQLLKTNSPKELRNNRELLNKVYRMRQSPSELNSLGYVFLDNNQINKALVTFYYNTRFYPYEPNVYDSYAEALEKTGEINEAIKNYEKVLLLDRSHKNAKNRLKELRKEIESQKK